MPWFGESWGAPVCDPADHVDTPFGAVCAWCDGLIDEDDSGFVYANGPAAHRDCFIRQAVGGVNHILKRCTCCGGTEPPDPEGMPRREAAALAVETFRKLERVRLEAELAVERIRRQHDGGGG